MPSTILLPSSRRAGPRLLGLGLALCVAPALAHAAPQTASGHVRVLAGPTGPAVPRALSRDLSPTTPRPDLVAETLESFGVATGQTPRLDDQGRPLGASYAPLGGTVELHRREELVICGLDQPGDDEQRMFWLWQDGAAGTNDWGSYDNELLYAMGADEMEDQTPPSAAGKAPHSYRAVAAGDLDGDGVEEVCVLHRDGAELRLRVLDDQQAGFATSEQLLAVDASIDDVAVCAADFDGDGKAEVAAAWSVDGAGVTLVLLDGAAGAMAVVHQVDLVPELFGSAFSLVLDAGNVDNDARAELALVVDENADPQGLCRWYLYDDLVARNALLAQGPLRSTYQEQTRTAVVGDVAFGDIDGDGRDELLLAGLTAFTHGCQQPDYLVLALDDAEHGFASLGTKHFHHAYVTSCGTGPKMVRWAHVECGDLDGDGRDEVLVNQWVYDDWIDGAGWSERWTLPADTVMAGGSWQYFDRSTSAFAIGDYTGNGRDDVITVRNGTYNVKVFELDEPLAGFVQRGLFWGEAYGAEWMWSNPVLVPCNVDRDATVLTHSASDYRFVFSEPIVLAAMAAPPFEAGIQQNYQACSTVFGNTVSGGTVEERTVSLSAGISVGLDLSLNLPLAPSLEVSESLTVEASHTDSHAYQLERTVLFQSGWSEDLVVFTTIPMDVYTYTVLVDEEHPELEGASFELRLPRSPIVLQADRAYYNEHLFEGGMRVDGSVFQHAIGDVSSYPGPLQKNQLLAQGGLQIGPQSVGQGSGSTQVTLQVSDEWSETGTLGMAYELEVKASGGGVMAGFTVGAAASNALTVTSGAQTTYTGTVGAIAAVDFPAHHYSFGLFTYLRQDPVRGYQFEVLNYWVE